MDYGALAKLVRTPTLARAKVKRSKTSTTKQSAGGLLSSLDEKLKNAAKAVHGGDVWEFFPIIDFSSNVNPFGPPRRAVEAVKKNLWTISYYPDLNAAKLREAVAEYCGATTENITLGNGSTEIIKNFAECAVSRGSNVVIAEPTFSEYEVYSRLYGAEIRNVYMQKEEDFVLRPEDVIKKIDSKTSAVFLCSPNNPTGRSIDEQDVEMILESALNKNSFIFLDEAYIEFSEKKSFCARVNEFDNLFVLRSLTKFFSIPGLRVGYGVGKIARYLEKIRIPWNVNVLAQAAAAASMKDSGFIARSKRQVKKERKFLFGQAERLGLKAYQSDANFILIELGGAKSREVKAALINRGILVRDCSSFKGLGDNFIRVSVRTRTENQKLLNGLIRVLR